MRPFLAAVLIAATAATTAAQAQTPLRALIGVELGVPRDVLMAASGGSCGSPGPNVVVCRGGFVLAPIAVSTTFWLEEGRLRRVYEVANPPGRDPEGWFSALALQQQRVRAALGPPSSVDAAPALTALPARDRLAAISRGESAMVVRWIVPGAEVVLALRGERGGPMLVLSVLPLAGCDRRTEELLFDLFPPAGAAERAAAARSLGTCKVARAVGALGTAIRHDPDLRVRVEAARAAGAVGGPAAAALLAEVLAGEPPPELRLEATLQLARLGDPAPARALLADAGAVDEQRAAAARALAAGGIRLSEDERDRFGVGAGPALREALAPEPAPSPAVSAAPPAPPPGVSLAASTPPPAVSRPPLDGVPLAVTTSVLAGGLWGGTLSLLAQQDSPGVVTLLGTAGAVIGGGTALGLTRFGVRPSPAQALWLANTTTWGTLAGLMAWAGSGSESARLKYGLIVAGESAGLAAGVLTRAHPGTAGELVMANGLVIGAGLGGLGVRRLLDPDGRLEVGPVTGYAAAPAMVAAALVSRHIHPNANDLRLVGVGAASAAWTGMLLGAGWTRDPLAERYSQGGLLVGLGFGGVAAVAASPLLDLPARRLWLSSAGLLVGNAAGLGASMLAAPEDERRWPLGSALGGVALGAVAMAAEPHVHPGPRAPSMTAAGTLYGVGAWALALRAASTGQPVDARVPGGMLLLGTGGAASGLVLSRWFAPDAADQLTAAAAAGLGIGAGLGVAKLFTDDKGAPELVGVLAGTGLGLFGGAAFTHRHSLRAPEVGAGFAGAGAGLLFGTLVPTLHLESFVQTRVVAGGSWLGLALGGLGGTAAARFAGADRGQVTVPVVAGILGMGMGTGVGMLTRAPGSQPARIGAVAGGATFIAAGALLDGPLRLSDGLGPRSGELALLGGLIGAVEGTLLAGALDPSGLAAQTPDRQVMGGLLLGASAGLATGLVLSRSIAPSGEEIAEVAGGGVLGGTLALGTSMLLTARTGRSDTVATMAGSLVGIGATATAVRLRPEGVPSSRAWVVGLGFGGLVGALAPSLDEDRWPGLERATGGGVLAGASAGSIGAMALRRATGASEASVTLAALGGADGALAGMGLGLLLDEPGSTRASRTGTVIGASAGLGIGALAWPRLRATNDDLLLVAALGLVGGWNGAFIPRLGHADEEDVSARKVAGGTFAGFGAGTFAATALVPALDVDSDLVVNAVALDALWSGAGAGIGALASARDDAPVWGLLGGGAAGLVAGGALHRAIDLDAADLPLLAMAPLHGLWYGAWLPYALRERDEVTDRQRAGSLAVGTLGVAGLAVVASPWLQPTGRQAALLTLGSGVGTSLAGGVALIADDVEGRRGVALMLGGTTAGLATGALLGERLQLDRAAVPHAVAGATLGASEALVFAWAARGAETGDYQGAALIGASAGATLGLAAAATPDVGVPRGLASAGFAAWGAWMGAFGGALGNRDPHEVTLGGLIGANAGFLGGYGLLRADVVEPRDFGWLSLGGALGTVALGGIGAVLSSRDDPRPVLAGLAVGPALGMAAAALSLPRLRALSNPSPASLRTPPTDGRGETAEESPEGDPARPDPEEDALRRPVWRSLAELFRVDAWMPVLGSLPRAPGEPGSGPVVFGIAGVLR